MSTDERGLARRRLILACLVVVAGWLTMVLAIALSVRY